MLIKRQIEFDGKNMWEYIDVGSSVQKDDMQAAIEAFVVMVLAQQAHWKEPVAYFLIKSLTGKEKANIIIESLNRLHEIGVIVSCLTCDGPSANLNNWDATLKMCMTCRRGLNIPTMKHNKFFVYWMHVIC